MHGREQREEGQNTCISKVECKKQKTHGKKNEFGSNRGDPKQWSEWKLH